MGNENQNFELACKEVVFHFNKKHLEDPTIPMWVIKTKGESYYVNHVECSIPWSTKETPKNSHTKGSLKIKRCHLIIDDDNTAHLRELTPETEQRLNKPDTVIRVITRHGDKLREACDGLEHREIKTVGGACSTTFYITEFNSDEEFVMFRLRCQAEDLRELKPNESYYKMYENDGDEDGYIDEDDWYFSRESLYEYDDKQPTRRKVKAKRRVDLKEKMMSWFT